MTQAEYIPQEPGEPPRSLEATSALPTPGSWGDRPDGWPGPWPPENGTRFLAAALEYAARGWRVHPLVPRDKKPLLDAWPDKATTDAATIISWWTRWPDANVGLVPGAKSAGLVI